MAASIIPQTPLALVLERLTGHDCQPKQRGGSWAAKCPSHADSTPSLTVSQSGDGRVLVNCFAGCPASSVVAALGLTMGDLFPDKGGKKAQREAYDPNARSALVRTYDYTDANGVLLYQSCRWRTAKGGKTFTQRQPHKTNPGQWVNNLTGVALVPYRLPQLIEAIAEERTVFVTEGEKDADTLVSYGYTATCNPMGAGKWRESFSPYFKGASVVVMQDNDDAGKSHAEQVAASLAAAGAASVKVVLLPGLPPKGDVTDWIEAGHDLDEFAEVVHAAPKWEPDLSKKTFWRLDEILSNEALMRPPIPVVPRLAWESRSTLLASAPKAGKSTLLGYLAAQVTLGGHFLGDQCNGGESGVVLIVGLEEFIGDLGRRLKHFGADPSKLYVLSALPSDPDARPSVVRERVREVKPVLVVTDSLIAYGSGNVSDWSASAQAEPIVQELTDLAHEEHLAHVIIHHAKKSDGGYRDSSAIAGAVDVVAEIRIPDDTDPTLRAAKVTGRVPTGDFRFRYDGREYLIDALADGTDLSLEDRIIAAVRSRPNCHTNDVADVVTGSRAAILSTIANLLARGRLRDDSSGGKGRRLYVP